MGCTRKVCKLPTLGTLTVLGINAKDSLHFTAGVVTSNIKTIFTIRRVDQKQLTAEKGNENCLF